MQLRVHLKKWTLKFKPLYLRNYADYFNIIRRTCCVNTHIKNLKVWIKSILPRLKYSIFFKGIVFFIGAPCIVRSASLPSGLKIEYMWFIFLKIGPISNYELTHFRTRNSCIFGMLSELYADMVMGSGFTGALIHPAICRWLNIELQLRSTTLMTLRAVMKVYNACSACAELLTSLSYCSEAHTDDNNRYQN